MALKLICDYCLNEIESRYTTMRIQTVDREGVTAEAEADAFEFHPGCYNLLQQVIVQFRMASPAPTLDPTPKEPPKVQPTNPDDPEPKLPKAKEPKPDPEPEPTPDVPIEPEPTPEPPAE